MEFIDAPKISDMEGIKKLGLDFKDVSKKKKESFLQINLIKIN